MSHRDGRCPNASTTHAQDLVAALVWLLDGVNWSGLRFRADCRWRPEGLAAAALLWSWSGEVTLGERLQQTWELLPGWCGRSRTPRTSYQAVLKLLVRWTDRLRDALIEALRRRMEHLCPESFRLAGFLVLAGDGSKGELPRTRSHEARFSPAKSRQRSRQAARRGSRTQSWAARRQRSRQKKADAPQLALTALLHVGLRLPWDWRIGPSDDSERDHLRQMLAGLPADALITADCGFVGYEFWKTLLDSGRPFVIRVGGNVRLLRKLGTVRESADTIYLWPNGAAERQEPPLILRLIVVQGARHPWYLVTSVRDRRRLSDRQVAEIYRCRWRIELFFRQVKQTYGRGKLRSRKAEHAVCEMEWSLLGLWTLLLYALKHNPTAQASPGRLSVARVLRIVRHAMHRPDRRGGNLPQALGRALTDGYPRRDKRSRGYPRKKYEPPAKPPHIRTATQAQRQQARKLSTQLTRKRLTA